MGRFLSEWEGHFTYLYNSLEQLCKGRKIERERERERERDLKALIANGPIQVGLQTSRKVRGPHFERLTQRESRVERSPWAHAARRQPIEGGPRTFLDVCTFSSWLSQESLS